MNLRYYDIFVRVYERMNMSIVAEEVFLSQPAVSRIIREMEDHYQIRFFLRQNGRLYRTAGGERMYQYAKELLACEDQLRSAIADQRKNRKVTMGVCPTMANGPLPEILRRYQDEVGELDVRLFSSRTETLEQQILDARMDFALVEGQVRSWDLTSRPLLEEEMVLVGGLDMPDYTPDASLALLLRDAGELERHQFEQVFRDSGTEYHVQGEFVDVESIKRCARQGLGVGVIPRRMWLETDGLKEMHIPGIQLTARYFLVCHRKKFLFPQLVTLINYIAEGLVGAPVDLRAEK